MRPVRTVIGVAGGFVLVGNRKGRPVLAHYDFPTRTCTAPPISERSGSESARSPGSTTPTCMRSSDFPQRPGSLAWPSTWPKTGAEARPRSRAVRAAERARAGLSPYPLPAAQLLTSPSDPWTDLSCRAVRLDAKTGTLEYRQGSGELRSLTPLSDGQSRPEGGADRLHAAGGRRPGDPAPGRAGRGHRVHLDLAGRRDRDVSRTGRPVPTARSPCPATDAGSRGGSTINRSRCATSPAIGRRCWSRPRRTSGSISPRWAGRACWSASSTWADRGARIRCA